MTAALLDRLTRLYLYLGSRSLGRHVGFSLP
jgi:hypothetical protein